MIPKKSGEVSINDFHHITLEMSMCLWQRCSLISLLNQKKKKVFTDHLNVEDWQIPYFVFIANECLDRKLDSSVFGVIA